MAEVEAESARSSVLPVFKRALLLDKEICMWLRFDVSQVYVYEFATRRIKSYTVGSVAEGSMSPRTYFPTPILELDRLHILSYTDKRLHFEAWQHLDKVPGRVGIYRGYAPKKLLFDHKEMVIKSKTYSGSPNWPDYLGGDMPDYYRNHDKYLPAWFKQVLKHRGHTEESQKHMSYRGPSKKFAQLKNSLPDIFSPKWSDTKNYHKQIDEVLCTTEERWPEEAEEWRNRPRKWPPKSLVDEIIDGGFLMITRMNDDISGDNTYADFSISFTLAEVRLAQHRNPVQKLVYLMAKTLFYTYLDIAEEKNDKIRFSSYALKTCMMWMVEETEADSWTEDCALILLHNLFTRLHDAVQKGWLSNYFMVKANVLHSCPRSLLHRVTVIIHQINSDMVGHLTSTHLHERQAKYTNEEFLLVLAKNQYNVFVETFHLMDKLCTIKATLNRIIKMLETGRGEDLHANGYTFNAEENFQVLKGAIQEMTDIYYHHDVPSSQEREKHRIGERNKRHIWTEDELLRYVFGLEKQGHKTPIVMARFPKGPEWACNKNIENFYFPTFLVQHAHIVLPFKEESDLLAVKRGRNVKIYKYSSIEGLIIFLERALQNLFEKKVKKLYTLTHRESEDQRRRNIKRMYYLLYQCKEKLAPDGKRK